MPFAASLSEHPITAYAAGEVCGEVLETLGTHPDVALVVTTLAHAGALEDVVATVDAVLHPAVVLAAATETVVATGREIEGGPAITLWAGQFGPVVPVRASATSSGIPTDLPFAPAGVVIMGDPFSASVDSILADARTLLPGVPVVGGLVAGARGPGGTRLALGSRIYDDGAVGVVFGPGVDVIPLVSQGCRPVGQPFVITDGSGHIIRELGGRPALERLDEMAPTLSPEEVKAVNAGGLTLGRVVDERKAEFGTGDFLVRNVIGGDRQTGAIAVGDEVDVGVTVQFHIRDRDSAHHELELLLRRDAASAGAEASLLFTCNGRGRALFGVPDHDAAMLAESIGPVPVAGFAAAGELGPVGGSNEVHTFTASLLLLREHRPET